MSVDMLQEFYEKFEMASDTFQTRTEDLLEKLHISTMTFTSKLTSCPSSLYATLLSLSPDMMSQRNLICIPDIRQSSFSKRAVDITPFHMIHDNIKLRVFCTTGSLLITGCTSLVQCLLALEELQRIIGGDVTYEIPTCRLINANCQVSYQISLEKVSKELSNCEKVLHVEIPERKSRLIVQLHDGTKVMIYASGKFSVHGSSFDSLTNAFHVIHPLLK